MRSCIQFLGATEFSFGIKLTSFLPTHKAPVVCSPSDFYVCCFDRPPVVDLRHNALGSGDGIRNDGFECRRSSLVSLCEFSRCKDAGSNQQNALSALVHTASLASSPYIRHAVS